MAWSVWVNGTDRTAYALMQTVSIRRAIGNSSASVVFQSGSYASGYRPIMGHELLIKDDAAATVFGGLIQILEETGTSGVNLVVRADAVGYQICANWCEITTDLAAGYTLRGMLDVIVSGALTLYGITRDAGMAAGPSLPAIKWDRRNVAEALSELCGIAGGTYVWDIAPDKTISIFDPALVAGAWNIADHDGTIRLDDCRIATSRDTYANAVRLICGDSSRVTVDTGFTDDDFTLSGGGDLVYTTTYPSADLSSTYPAIITYSTGAGWNDVPVGLSTGSGRDFVWDWTTHQMTYFGPLMPDGDFGIIYTAQYPFEVVVSTGSGDRQITLTAPSVMDYTAGAALAEAYFDARHTTRTDLRFTTYKDGLEPGTMIEIVISERSVDMNAVILEVETACLSSTTRVHRIVATGINAEGTIGMPPGGPFPGVSDPLSAAGFASAKSLALLGGAINVMRLDTRIGDASVNDWMSQAYSSGDYTINSTGAWNVDATDMVGFSAYQFAPNAMAVSFALFHTQVTPPSGSQLRIAIPGGRTANGQHLGMGWLSESGTVGTIVPQVNNSTYIILAKPDSANFSTCGSNALYVSGQLMFPLTT